MDSENADVDGRDYASPFLKNFNYLEKYVGKSKRTGIIVIAISLCILISMGCGAKSTTFALNFTAYNHTDDGIGWYSIRIGDTSGGSAGYLDTGAGGGGLSCCIVMPSTWNSDIRIKVSWLRMVDNKERNFVELVSVPKYDASTASTLNVHFLRNGKVKVFVTRVMLGHRDYPLKGKEAELKPGIPIKIIWP